MNGTILFCNSVCQFTQYNPVVRLGRSYIRIYFYPRGFTLGQSEINRIKADLKDCASNNNKNLNDCLLNLASEIKPYLKTGVPELNIPQADPLSIER